MIALKKILSVIMAMTLFSSCMYSGAKIENTVDPSIERLKQLKSSSVICVSEEIGGRQETAKTSSRLNYDETKAVWLSYIDLAPMLENVKEEDFAAEFEAACEEISSLGLNTIFVHVRPFGDALYCSELFPPSVYLKGDYDPLEIMCETAHEYELSVHAWINPLRLQSEDILSGISKNYSTAKWFNDDNGMVRSVENSANLWLDPSYPEVRELIAQGTAEIVQNYEVDGIHYDDYFYPTTDKSFDAKCFANSGSASLSSWRLDNISLMCREIYSAVKEENEDVMVSISPQGNIDNNYKYMYADVKRWCAEDGFCDVIVPQIYFGYDNAVKPFSSTLDEWAGICQNDNIRLVVGLAPYKIGEDDEFTQNVGIIASQAEDCSVNEKCSGVSFYSYSALFSQDDGRTQRERQLIKKAIFSEK